MPRRKNAFLSDGSDSDASVSADSIDDYNSQEDEDSRAERRLFEHKGKKRKTGGRSGKESAWEGVFGEDDEEATGRGGRGLGAKGRRAAGSRTDWTKAPAFVSTSGPSTSNQTDENAKESADEAGEGDDDDDDLDDGSAESEEEEVSRQPSPRIRTEEDDEDEPPRRGMGLGFKNGFARAGEGQSVTPDPVPASSAGRGGIGSGSRGRGGIGPTSQQANVSPPRAFTPMEAPRGGLGSNQAPVNPIDETANSTPSAVPTSFGRPPPPSLTASSGPPRKQQSFLARPTPASTSQATQLTAAERAHFNNISSSFGARMLAKQGWEAGKGLGAQEDGRAVPIQVGKVFRGQGIQKGMRTEDSKREARRMGHTFSDDEDEKPKKGHKGRALKGPKKPEDEDDQGWKKQRKVKVKVEHKTYEQLLAEAGDSTVSGSGVGLVLDARGGDLKEVQSLSSLSLSTWTPSSDATRLPELRHNLRLIVDVNKGDVEGLIREAKSVNERRRWALREEQISRAKVEETEKHIYRVKQIQDLVARVSNLVTEQAQSADSSLTAFTESFNSLIHDFKEEYQSFGLDDVVVGAIAQVTRRAFAEWQPFDISSDLLLSSLKQWRKAYNLPHDEEDEGAIAVNGIERTNGTSQRRENGDGVMTAWESLLWSSWIPKVRSSINNDWDPASPDAAVHLLESWDPILPPFIRDNVLDQLILPKVKAAIEMWDPRKARLSKSSRSLASIVFPWLPLLGDRSEEILDGAKRRIRSVLRNWVVKDGVPEELGRWRNDVYSSSEWDKLIIQFVLPKLGVCLRDDFAINPRKQDMVPLQDWIMPWHALLRSSMFSHLLEVEFFPKWLDILYIWLVQPAYKPDEVANWFVWWKGRFPDAVLEMRGIDHGFNSGLELMNEAMRLGTEAPSKLQKPVFEPLPPSKTSKSSKTSSARKPNPTVCAAEDAPDITFRSIAEDYAAQRDLIFLPIGKSHDQTGKPLFKVSKGVDGRGGVTVYIGEAAVFAQGQDGSFRAVSLEDMVKRAGA
ncbi:tuftelin-interacting protein 11 [Kwoniella heveanensis BCC8398]|uniref:Tuftelin-interacting protein 11 n=1 Tax=Kwoniella heveanensis BCC8398 TaxID=1296120 RepID=A0A1B9GJZ3_9TREE|nr:tuftelin-interacting protein 11 [Kwoniella heveanensis BCC8398]